MTISEPIPVAEAIKAVQAAIEVCNRAKVHGVLSRFVDGREFVKIARAGYAGTLEYFLWLLNDMTGSGGIEEIDDGYAAYAAVAPIVEWYRQTGAQEGEL